MAIYTRALNGNFYETLEKIHDGILNGVFRPATRTEARAK